MMIKFTKKFNYKLINTWDTYKKNLTKNKVVQHNYLVEDVSDVQILLKPKNIIYTDYKFNGSLDTFFYIEIIWNEKNQIYIKFRT